MIWNRIYILICRVNFVVEILGVGRVVDIEIKVVRFIFKIEFFLGFFI